MEMGEAKCVCYCRRTGRAGTSNRWWGSAVQLRALGAEGCDALVATGVTPAGVWR
jgi:hypothetical protein